MNSTSWWMQRTRSSNPELEQLDPEIDRTFHQRVREQRQQIIDERMNENPFFDQPRNENVENNAENNANATENRQIIHDRLDCLTEERNMIMRHP